MHAGRKRRVGAWRSGRMSTNGAVPLDGVEAESRTGHRSSRGPVWPSLANRGRTVARQVRTPLERRAGTEAVVSGRESPVGLTTW